MATKIELFTLHKYFLNASLMKHELDLILKNPTADKNSSNPNVWSYISLWYGCLRVVIEGWKDLNLTDPLVDPLLIDEKITLLNGFRNDTFHFKPDYVSKRSIALLDDKDFVKWIRDLHDPLGHSILVQLKAAK